jgi:hypothetical protein
MKNKIYTFNALVKIELLITTDELKTLSRNRIFKRVLVRK